MRGQAAPDAAPLLTTLLLAATLWAGCPRVEAPDPSPHHLLSGGVAVTLGDETRFASGDEPVRVLHGTFATREGLPASVDLPSGFAVGDAVLLHYRVFTGPTPPVRGSARVIATAGPRGPRVPLPDLRERISTTPFTLAVELLPLPESAEPPLRRTVTIAPGDELAFGYGLRDEIWQVPSLATVFRIALIDAAGERHALFEATLDAARPEHRRWFDAAVDLGAFAGQRATLEFSAAPAGGGPGLSLPSWADPTIYAPRAVSDRPNLVLISVDTLRARSLGSYGYGRDTAPFLDTVAADGTLFENAITPSVTTGPAHMSLFTGLYPAKHGMRVGGNRLRPGVPTLAETLRDAGFRTAAFTENGYLVRRRGFGRGFLEYTENRGGASRAIGEVRRTFGQARAWLERSQVEPFFLFLHTYEVHSPYAPAPPYADRFRGDGAPGPEDPALRNARDDYDREIRVVDDETRSLFATLASRDLTRRTIVVILSDHGEEFGEHGRFQHGGAVYEESLRVPLLIYGPGRIPAGQRIDTPISLIDVAPTLLDLVGVDPPSGLDGASLQGLLLRDEPLAPRTLFAEAQAQHRWLRPGVGQVWNPPLVAVRTPTAKFIVHRPAEGTAQPPVAFDLVRDPGEQSPQPVDPSRAEAVLKLVDTYLGQRPVNDDAGAETLPPDLVGRLRRLGYVE